MGSPENSPAGDTNEPLNYNRGDTVRIYRDLDGSGLVAEDDWKYRGYEEADDHEVAARDHPEGTHTELIRSPKPEFDAWQREKAAEEAGRLVTEDTVETTSGAETIIDDDSEFVEESGEAVWQGPYGDIPIKIIGSYGFGPNGRKYFRIEGSSVGIPEDEISRVEEGVERETDIDNTKVYTSREPGGEPGTKYEGIRRSHFGGWTDDGRYWFVYEPARIAERINIPEEVLVAAAEKGISPEYLNQARHNETAGRYLRERGIDWGAVAEPLPASAIEFRDVTDAERKAAHEVSGREVTPEHIEMAKIEYERGNSFPAEYLASIGIDIGVERLDPPDPVTIANSVGRKRIQDIAALTKEIREKPGDVSRRLRRPASLPLPRMFYEQPVLRFLVTDRLNFITAPIAKRILAWRVARKELHERPEHIREQRERLAHLQTIASGELTSSETAELKDLERSIPALEQSLRSDRGLLRIGLPAYRHAHDYIDTLDESVSSHRRQLSLAARHKLHDVNTAPRDLAYRIYDALSSLRVLKEKHVLTDYDDPEMVHNHERFKRQRDAFVQEYIRNRAGS